MTSSVPGYLTMKLERGNVLKAFFSTRWSVLFCPVYTSVNVDWCAIWQRVDLFPQRTVTNPVTSLNGDAKTPDHTPLTLTAHYQEVSNDIGYSTTALFWYIAPYCLQFIVALRITTILHNLVLIHTLFIFLTLGVNQTLWLLLRL